MKESNVPLSWVTLIVFFEVITYSNTSIYGSRNNVIISVSVDIASSRERHIPSLDYGSLLSQIR